MDTTGKKKETLLTAIDNYIDARIKADRENRNCRFSFATCDRVDEARQKLKNEIDKIL